MVQIAHGMGEHIGRYAVTIEALVSAGWTVYGNDHRGHGRTAPSAARLGDFGEGGFDLLVADMFHLSRIAKEENPGKPFMLMGHSMGSFASQQYILDHSREADGMILSGSGALDALGRMASEAPAGKNILNAQFEPARTQLDWLTRDIAVVDAFINGPAVLRTTSARVLCSVSRGGAPVVRSGWPWQNPRRFAHLPVFRRRRSRRATTAGSQASGGALSSRGSPPHLSGFLLGRTARGA